MFKQTSVLAALSLLSACSVPTVGRMGHGTESFRGVASPEQVTLRSSTGATCLTTKISAMSGTIACNDGRTGTYRLDRDPSVKVVDVLIPGAGIDNMFGTGQGILDGAAFSFAYGPNL